MHKSKMLAENDICCVNHAQLRLITPALNTEVLAGPLALTADQRSANIGNQNGMNKKWSVQNYSKT